MFAAVPVHIYAETNTFLMNVWTHRGPAKVLQRIFTKVSLCWSQKTFPGLGLNRIFWTANQLPLLFTCLWPCSCAACRMLSNALGTAATAVLMKRQILLLISACGHAAGQESPWIMGCSPQVPSRTGLPPSAVAGAWCQYSEPGTLNGGNNEYHHAGARREALWVVREKRGWLRRQGSESANHAKPVLCQAENN